MEITTVIFGVMAASTLVSGYKHFETCCLQFRDGMCTEDGGNKSSKQKKFPTDYELRGITNHDHNLIAGSSDKTDCYVPPERPSL